MLTNHSRAMLEISLTTRAARDLAARSPRYRVLAALGASHALGAILPTATRAQVNEAVTIALLAPHFSEVLRSSLTGSILARAISGATISFESRYAAEGTAGLARVTLDPTAYNLVTIDPAAKLLKGHRHANPVYALTEPGFLAELAGPDGRVRLDVSLDPSRTNRASRIHDRVLDLAGLNERLAHLGRG